MINKDQTLDDLLYEYDNKGNQDPFEIIHLLRVELAGKESAIKVLEQDIEYYKTAYFNGR